MMRSRIARVATLVVAAGLCFGVAAAPSGAATKYKATGDGTADTAGAIAVSMSSTKLVADVTGQLATGTGTGKKKASSTASTDAEGGFIGDFSSGQMTGIVSGRILSHLPPAGTALTIEINCTVSYPPLSIKCVTIVTF
jgi:hypothetical protein